MEPKAESPKNSSTPDIGVVAPISTFAEEINNEPVELAEDGSNLMEWFYGGVEEEVVPDTGRNNMLLPSPLQEPPSEVNPPITRADFKGDE